MNTRYKKIETLTIQDSASNEKKSASQKDINKKKTALRLGSEVY